ncbi:uncharacterized protein PITG_05848 [Phytophthora infestans T30-4]|uniref:Uncharacterized protein n=1 Tax=Phytophthora infestans (strain T30-4) TaxID=403677 RepID=D0N5U2_PHYIT|nr:uncharacterized protein PITG_05848 [Phytophthora infestans T30-4]EEY70433.1 hypothetical protein PITG_05848 [Phytophthora infestans T30-4]|eukprot:XP_002998087.1 hypothetical protein PITG_05848 [Phytophthora infestans T30-4]
MSSTNGSDAGRREVGNKLNPNQGEQAGGAVQRIDSAAIVAGSNRSNIGLKMITVKKFDGPTRNGYLNSGAYDWLERLKVQINLAERLTERKGPEKVNVKTVAVKLAETRSFPTEPYAEYAHNLSQIATGLNQGKASNYTEQQAPSTLVNYAHPLLKTDLEAMLDPKMEDTTFKLDGAAVLLTRLAKRAGGSSRFLDSGASNHMTGDSTPLVDITTSVATNAVTPRGHEIATSNSLEDWHRRLRQLRYQAIVDLEKGRLVSGLHITGTHCTAM